MHMRAFAFKRVSGWFIVAGLTAFAWSNAAAQQPAPRVLPQYAPPSQGPQNVPQQQQYTPAPPRYTAQPQQQIQPPAADPRVRPAQFANPNGANPSGIAPNAPGVVQLPQIQPGNQNQLGNLNPQGNPGQPVQLMPPVQIQPVVRAPFVLTPAEQADLENVLTAWEKVSENIKTFKCTFTRWEYDPTLISLTSPRTESAGEIRFLSPDQGRFEIKATKIAQAEPVDPKFPDAPPKFKLTAGTQDDLEYWACDGNSMYQMKFKEKQMEVTALPANMRGKAIADGPLPFVFGQKKDQMLKRYWVRLTTPPNVQGKEIWLEVFPKYQSDAANYIKIDLILSAKELLPLAMQQHLRQVQVGAKTTTQRTVYRFTDHEMNGIWANALGGFAEPVMPRGFKKIVRNYEDPAAPPPQNPIGRQLPPAQANGSPATLPSGQLTNQPVNKLPMTNPNLVPRTALGPAPNSTVSPGNVPNRPIQR